MVACNEVEVPNFWGCVKLNDDMGYCHKSMSSEEFIIRNTPDGALNGMMWNELKDMGVYLPPESYSEIKAFSLKICKKSKDCNIQELKSRFEKIEYFNMNLISE